MSLLVERGWVVLRAMVPKTELDAMHAHVGSIQEPMRSMCGASGFQPSACFVQSRNHFQGLFPRFHRRLVDLLEGWVTKACH